MPLSEEELRALEQMERALAEEDPKFASALRGRAFQRGARMRVILAGVIFLVGIALLLGGAMARLTWVGIIGFVVMLASTTIGLTAWRGRLAPHEPNHSDALFDFNDNGHPFHLVHGGRSDKRSKRPRSGGKAKPHGSFMHRLEERWQRRRDQGL